MAFSVYTYETYMVDELSPIDIKMIRTNKTN